MTKFIISRGECVAHNIINEAADKNAAEAAAKEIPVDNDSWRDSEPTSHDVIYESDGAPL